MHLCKKVIINLFLKLQFH